MDYNIYIHSIGDAGGGSPTQPWQTSKQKLPTQPWGSEEGDDEVGETLNQGVKTFSQIPKQIIDTVKGSAFLSKVTPWVAAAMVAVKTTQIVLNTGAKVTNFVASQYTGDYSSAIRWADTSRLFDRVFHPIKSAWNDYKEWHTSYKVTMQHRKETTLLGDSYLNSLVRKGG